MDPGDLWEKIFAGLGMDFGEKLPAGKGPGNPGVHPCQALCEFRPILSISLSIHPIIQVPCV